MCDLSKPIFHSAQYGSIEGKIIRVYTYYHQPAILVRERITGADIRCIVDEKHRELIGKEAGFEDVWSEHRVSVRGKLEYDDSGELSSVVAVDVRLISGKPVSLDSIRDPEFTDGLKPSDYLDRFREGEID